ncbi:M12 family metallo-peptidase [Kitasatospora sp. NPDC101801]|uniref:InlB B-repeat-containing protein n=1 Tax=Kitasatospora sp. NPDC101801 TaxID=3364103 RepID=UPI003817B0C9
MTGVLALTAVVLSGVAGAATASPGRAGPARDTATPAVAGDPGGQGVALRSADIAWNLGEVRPLLCDPADEAGPEITLRLFPDVSVEVTGGQVRPAAAGEVDWAAQVKGDPEGSADFHFDALCSGLDGSSAQVAAQISTGGHVYTLTSTTPGTVRVREINPGLSEGTAGHPDDAQEPPDDQAAPSAADPGRRADPSDCQGAKDVNTIDMAVFYTKEAAAKAGGEDKAKAQAKLGADLTNRGFTNSKLAVRVRLVYVGPAAGEPGLPPVEKDDLGAYRQWALDNALWTKYAADDIAVFQSVGSGVGYVDQDPKASSAKRMFLLMNIAYVPTLTLGHELGHNLGLDHDWETELAAANGPYTPKYPHAHGWIAPSKKWRTIMAYGGGCAGCERINHYSDAQAAYEGEPLGAPDSAAQPADAVRMIRRNAPTVAAMQPERTPAVYCRLTVKSTPDTGGSATLDVLGPYTRGSLVHATATTAPNHRLIGWSLNGTPLADTDTSVSVAVDADSVLEARYAPIDCALTLRTQPADGGTATADRPAPYRCGSTVTLTATPAPGWTFTGWNSENAPPRRGIVSTTPVHQLTLDQDTEMTATFAKSDDVPPKPPVPDPPVPPNPDTQPAPNPPVPPTPDTQPTPNLPAPPTPATTEAAGTKPELASTGTPSPLGAIAVTAGLLTAVGGTLLIRHRRRPHSS